MKNKLVSIATVLLATVFLSTASMSQMGRKGSSFGGSSRPSYSPRSSSSGGMGRSNGSYRQPSTSPSSSSGMGRSGSFNSSPNRQSSPSYSTSSRRSSSPNVGGASSSTTHVYSIGSRPSVSYSRTTIVNGRTQYIYPDGSYSWSATGVIVGYLAQQNAYNQGVADANRYNNGYDNYNNGYGQPVVVNSGVSGGFIVFVAVVLLVVVFFISSMR